ncbi:MAG: LapA family protein [Candidatus Aminicenantales bacterium]
MKTKWIVILIFLVLLAILLIQNREIVTFRLFFWKIAMSQVILVPIAMFVGFVVGFLLARLRKDIPKLKIK